MKKTYLILLLVLLALIAGCAQTSTQTSSEDQQPLVIDNTKKQTVEEPPQQETATAQSTNKNIVEITSLGFNPGTLTINLGKTVTFINKDTQSHWVASAVHPTHLAYPETGGCIGSKFDSCHGLMQDESFSFTFNNKGSWEYHDHLRPGITGTIVVK